MKKIIGLKEAQQYFKKWEGRYVTAFYFNPVNGQAICEDYDLDCYSMSEMQNYIEQNRKKGFVYLKVNKNEVFVNGLRKGLEYLKNFICERWPEYKN